MHIKIKLCVPPSHPVASTFIMGAANSDRKKMSQLYMLVLTLPVKLELTRTLDYQGVSNIPFLSSSYFSKEGEVSFTF